MTLATAILRAASVVVPAAARADWLDEWRSELWYIDPRDRAAFSLGAFRDALWLRRNRPSASLVSPLECLAFLTMLATASLLATLLLPAPHTMGATRLKLRDLPTGLVAMLLLSSLLLPATRLVIGPPPAAPRPLPLSTRLRNGAFLTLKLLLVQPILLCSFLLLLQALPVIPIAPQLAVCGSWILCFRWVLDDQRRRCPVCLHRLTAPVRIGSASETFLEWYGDESVCSRGHGLLQHPDLTAAYSATSRWLRLDPSWNSLFPAPRGRRP